VYSQWYPEIKGTLRRNEAAKNKNPMDRKPQFHEVRQVLHHRALPLLIAALLLVLALLPDAVEITLLSARLYVEKGPQAVQSYSTVSTAYVLSVFLGVAFCAHLSGLVYEVGRLKKALSPDPRN
jgi:hypothetical protein